MTSLPRVLLVAILLAPVAAYSQSGGGGGAGEADRLVVERAAGVLPVGQLVVRLPEAQAQWAHRVQDPLEQVRRL